MTPYTQDEIVAAIERATLARLREATSTQYPTQADNDAAILRALADAVREGQEAWQHGRSMTMYRREADDDVTDWRSFRPVLIVPMEETTKPAQNPPPRSANGLEGHD